MEIIKKKKNAAVFLLKKPFQSLNNWIIKLQRKDMSYSFLFDIMMLFWVVWLVLKSLTVENANGLNKAKETSHCFQPL